MAKLTGTFLQHLGTNRPKKKTDRKGAIFLKQYFTQKSDLPSNDIYERTLTLLQVSAI
jgi:hypothetical protein